MRYRSQAIAVAVVLAQRCGSVAAALRRSAGYGFPILCDERRVAIKAYGVWDPIGLASLNTSHPAAFLIDARERTIRYAFVGSSQFERAPLDMILAAAE